MQRIGFKLAIWFISLFLLSALIPPTLAQGSIFNLPGLNLQQPNLFSPSPPISNIDASIDVEAVRLDGHQLFLVTALAIEMDEAAESPGMILPIHERVQEIEMSLNRFVQSEFNPETLRINYQILNGLPVIYANDRLLVTVTDQDAKIYGVEPKERAEELIPILKSALIRAKRERQPEFIKKQAILALQSLIGIIGLSLCFYYLQRRLKQQGQILLLPGSMHYEVPVTADKADKMESSEISESQDRLTSIDSLENCPESEVIPFAQQQASNRQKIHINEIQRRFLQIAQFSLWGGGIYQVLGLFAQTRSIQYVVLMGIRIPLLVFVVGIGTYMTIRLSAVLISRIMWAIEDNHLRTPAASKRLVLRISTFSQVLKRISALVLVVCGVLTSLAIMGIPIAPILAGAGILGLGISFASQSVIKDVINGILILLEDQYGVGDVIVVGDLGGLVENMDLRITQLRDTEGSLITIPNGEIRAVKNLSKEWSRVDLNVLIAYNTDLNQALQIIESTALKMSRDSHWRTAIVEPPEVLGVDDFGERGIVIKIWIKTQPLKQWSVAREYRRRLKNAFDRVGIVIPLPQRELWFQTSPLPSDLPSHSNIN